MWERGGGAWWCVVLLAAVSELIDGSGEVSYLYSVLCTLSGALRGVLRAY
jgi:hypothetical protein